MDEIDWRKSLKKVLVGFSIVPAVIDIFIIIVAILGRIINIR